MRKMINLVFAILSLCIGFQANAQIWMAKAMETQTQTALAEWVRSSSKNSVSESDANRTVSETFRYGKERGIDPLLILSIIKAESGFNRLAKSFVGAVGVMQVWPKYHKDKLRGRNPYDIGVSVDVGTTILDNCLDQNRNNVHGALKCYSGGARWKYNKGIMETHAQLRRYLTETAFANEHPIQPTNRFGDARIQYEDKITYLAELQLLYRR